MIGTLLLTVAMMAPKAPAHPARLMWSPEKITVVRNTTDECWRSGPLRLCRFSQGWVILGTFHDNPNWIRVLQTTPTKRTPK